MSAREIYQELLRVFLLLRPKFYNKITWAVVISGLALVSTGLVERIVISFIETNFRLRLTEQSDSYIGLALVSIGLIYHAVIRNFELKEQAEASQGEKLKIVEHDAGVFNKLDTVLSEEKLKSILDWIGSDHSVYSEQLHAIDEFLKLIEQHSYEYLTPEIEEACGNLRSSMSKLRSFISLNFFVHPKGQVEIKRFCLYPELNWDRGGNPTDEESQRYDQRAIEMFENIDESFNDYAKYRRAVKEYLHI